MLITIIEPISRGITNPVPGAENSTKAKIINYDEIFFSFDISGGNIISTYIRSVFNDYNFKTLFSLHCLKKQTHMVV